MSRWTVGWGRAQAWLADRGWDRPGGGQIIAMLAVGAACYVGLMGLIAELARPGSPADPPRLDGSVEAELTRVENREFLVGLSLLVTGREGEVLGGLSATSFEVAEDGQPVAFEEFRAAGQQPIRVGLVIDHSGSMSSDDRIGGARAAARAFLALMRDDVDELALTAFDDRTATPLPLGPMNEQARRRAVEAIDELRPRGGTFLFAALQEALRGMAGASGRRIVLALTDGQDSSGRNEIEAVVTLANELNVPIFTIGLGDPAGVDEPTLRTLADRTGGKYYSAPSPSQLAELYRSIGRTLQDEYSMNYRSPYPVLDGQARRVTVTVRRGESGAIAEGSYPVGGLIGLTRSGAEAGAVGTGPPSGGGAFATAFFPWLIVLCVLFAVPYARLMRRSVAASQVGATGSTSPPPVSPATATFTSPTTDSWPGLAPAPPPPQIRPVPPPSARPVPASPPPPPPPLRPASAPPSPPASSPRPAPSPPATGRQGVAPIRPIIAAPPRAAPPNLGGDPGLPDLPRTSSTPAAPAPASIPPPPSGPVSAGSDRCPKGHRLNLADRYCVVCDEYY